MPQITVAIAILSCLACALSTDMQAADLPAKTAGVLFPKELVGKVKANTAKHVWAAALRDRIVQAAEPWKKLSDDELWAQMFSPGITRSWMVWSNGFCPACKSGVEMYTWQMDPIKMPWKVRCPHCKETFPKNDFRKFYLSGLDEKGIFDPKRADRSLLFNTDHPDPADPLHSFGVDDGEGYTEGDKRWRFIGAYLIYGQWKQMVLGGISHLAAAYVTTGDNVYAHKAAVMLDRVADLYPSFDYATQGLVYEKPSGAGYISIWHDACEEARQLATTYDWIFDGIKDDPSLVAFLSEQARGHKLSNPKTSFADIQRNIEDGILRDQVKNRAKITSNYPRTDIAVAMTQTVLGWPANREEVLGIIDGLLDKGTAVDGVTGEKGLADYSAQGVMVMGALLAQYTRVDPDFLKQMLARHPRLSQTFRFHLDTWCLGEYYPLVGDTGWFGGRFDQYRGANFVKARELDPDLYAFYWSLPGLDPSMFTFLWDLYRVTGDAAYVQALYRANDSTTRGLPYELTVDDPAAFEKNVAAVIARAGTEIPLGSVNKQEWHLAILRSGKGRDARALWLNYESGGQHGGCDGMNLGLFAKGLDLMPDYGYPPVNFGGWDSPRAQWYRATAAHNTVTVDGRNLASVPGKTTLWADGKIFHAIRASAPAMIGGKQYERTAAMVDISDGDSYVLDIFRVAGGTVHDKFTGSFFGTVKTEGLTLGPAIEYGHGAQLRDMRMDASAKPGWSVDWSIEDRYKYLAAGADVHFRYTDLTSDAQAAVGEAWITYGDFGVNSEAWVPRALTRRTSKDAPLASTFVAVLEPYERSSNVAAIHRLPLVTRSGKTCPDSDAAVKITLTDGRRDLILSRDAENSRSPEMLTQEKWGLCTDCELCIARLRADGSVERVVLSKGSYLGIADLAVKLKAPTEFAELTIDGGRPKIVGGEADF
jgi:hypothetical protein